MDSLLSITVGLLFIVAFIIVGGVLLYCLYLFMKFIKKRRFKLFLEQQLEKRNILIKQVTLLNNPFDADNARSVGNPFDVFGFKTFKYLVQYNDGQMDRERIIEESSLLFWVRKTDLKDS